MSSLRPAPPLAEAQRPEPFLRPDWTALLVLSLAFGCATPPDGPGPLGFDSPSKTLRQDRRASFRSASAPARGEVGPIEARLLDTDYFFGLMVRAGVPPSELPQDRRHLSPDDAARLLNLVLAAEVHLKDFGPWRMAAQLLLEVAEGEAAFGST